MFTPLFAVYVSCAVATGHGGIQTVENEAHPAPVRLAVCVDVSTGNVFDVNTTDTDATPLE
jgi:hypothetical protein